MHDAAVSVQAVICTWVVLGGCRHYTVCVSQSVSFIPRRACNTDAIDQVDPLLLLASGVCTGILRVVMGKDMAWMIGMCETRNIHT